MKITLLSITLAAAALLSACGGGGGDAGGPPPTVASATITNSARYSDTLSFTLLGTNLDQNLNFTSGGCRNFTRLTTAPTQSTATVAYYTCTVSGTGAQTITVSSSAVMGALATMPFTIDIPQVTMLVSNGAGVAGSMVITLRPDLAPITVDNFLTYVKSGFYNNTVFHRNGRSSTGGPFVLQGGGYAAPLTSAALFPAPKATNAPIVLERGLSNLRYTLAMARTSAANSATSQFFINTTDNVFLDTSGGGYATFGTVTTGTTLVDQMDAAPCNQSAGNFGIGSLDCLPEPNLVIASAQQTR
jgi:cyclophilin family peptidyl-prolyl cis-trans isomerase